MGGFKITVHIHKMEVMDTRKFIECHHRARLREFINIRPPSDYTLDSLAQATTYAECGPLFPAGCTHTLDGRPDPQEYMCARERAQTRCCQAARIERYIDI
jgi:hypothetical protein